MSLKADYNLNQIKSWLGKNLKENKSIQAKSDNIKSIPELKGIYFWFMRTEGYNQINKYIAINRLAEAYSKRINGIDYDLVYLGTAGVRNNSKQTNNGNLKERLSWHLYKNQTDSSKKNGTISTFRTSIEALLGKDLSHTAAQIKIDELFEEYFQIYYLEYPGTFSEVKDEVAEDEKILIDGLRPLFNLKNNKNVTNPEHSTAKITLARKNLKDKVDNRLVENKTKGKSSKGNPINIKQQLEPVDGGINAQSRSNNCIEITISSNESIHEVINKQNNLPSACQFECLDPTNNQQVYKSENGKPRKTGKSKSGQNIYSYFNNTDDAYCVRHQLKNKMKRWEIIQHEMALNNIKTIKLII